MDQDILRKLEERLGPRYARQRLGIETDQEAQIFGQSLLSFHIGNWYPVHSVIRNTLKLTGLYWRARRNTERILVKRNDVMFKGLLQEMHAKSVDLYLHTQGLDTSTCRPRHVSDAWRVRRI